MSFRGIKIACCMLMAALVVFSVPEAAAKQGGNQEKFDTRGKKFDPGATTFCWRNSYTTGKGRKQNCGSGAESVGRFCLKTCPEGLARVGFKCMSTCPDGTEAKGKNDKGRVCQINKTEYPNTETFKKKDLAACKKKNAKCVLNGSGRFVKACKAGFKAVGKKCKLEVKDFCDAFGMNTGIGKSCKREVQRSTHMKKAGCNSNEEKSFGRCFKKCNKGDYRIGISCWMKVPPKWVKCGLGAAKNKNQCAMVVGSQVYATGKIAANIATMGGAEAIDNTVGSIDDGDDIASVANQFDDLVNSVEALRLTDDGRNVGELWKDSQDFRELASATNSVRSAGTTASESSLTVHDYARVSSTLLSIFDPTGISDVVSAYTYAPCNMHYK